MSDSRDGSAPEPMDAGRLRSVEQYGGLQIQMADAIDLHCHPYPDLFARSGDDLSLATAARDVGMRAIVLKCHHESTVSRAYHVQKLLPDIQVFGGIVLNSYVGFVNPAAVEAALRLGGKVVWMPTVDAGYHAQMHGGTGGYDLQSGGRSGGKGVWILDDRGELLPEIYEIFDLISEHDAILGTCHLSPREIVALVRAATERGIQKITVTHPFFKVPNLDMDTVQELARLGAYLEFGYCTVSPMWHYATPEKVQQAISLVGASRCLLVSDTGQRHNPLPHEALRVFAQTLFERGVEEDVLGRITQQNQMELLGLGPRPVVSTPQVPELTVN